MNTNTKRVTLEQAESAVFTSKDVIGDIQRCFKASTQQECMPRILIRFRKLLGSLKDIFGWECADPTVEDFRKCHTPFNALQLMQQLSHTLSGQHHSGVPALNQAIAKIIADAGQSIATSPVHKVIATDRNLVPIPGYGLPKWVTIEDGKPVFGPISSASAPNSIGSGQSWICRLIGKIRPGGRGTTSAARERPG